MSPLAFQVFRLHKSTGRPLGQRKLEREIEGSKNEANDFSSFPENYSETEQDASGAKVKKKRTVRSAGQSRRAVATSEETKTAERNARCLAVPDSSAKRRAVWPLT